MHSIHVKYIMYVFYMILVFYTIYMFYIFHLFYIIYSLNKMYYMHSCLNLLEAPCIKLPIKNGANLSVRPYY
jgi:hypothetical protein